MSKKILLTAWLSITTCFVFSQTNIFPSSGNVGVGTTIPSFAIDVNNSTSDYSLQLVGNGRYNNWMYMSNNDINGASGIRFINDNGIGVQMMMGGSTNAYFPNEFAFDQISGNLAFSARTGVIDFRTIGPWAGNSVMRILNNGNVGIGTMAPDAKLDVNGTTYSRKVFIGLPDANTVSNMGSNNLLAVNGTAVFVKAKVAVYGSTWPDYVFTPNYKLTSLDSLEQFIQLNKHLPEVPTADDVQKNGIDLGENQALLLKKIEELTLIVIEQNKRIDSLQSKFRLFSKDN